MHFQIRPLLLSQRMAVPSLPSCLVLVNLSSKIEVLTTPVRVTFPGSNSEFGSMCPRLFSL